MTRLDKATVDELIRRAAACDVCGREHKIRALTEGRDVPLMTWADPIDGHEYKREWLLARMPITDWLVMQIITQTDPQ